MQICKIGDGSKKNYQFKNYFRCLLSFRVCVTQEICNGAQAIVLLKSHTGVTEKGGWGRDMFSYNTEI